MRRFLAAFLILAASVTVALAGVQLPPGVWIFSFPGPPVEMVTVFSHAGDPPWIDIEGKRYDWDASEGKFIASDGDTVELGTLGGSGGTLTLCDYPTPPMQGPPVVKTGTYYPEQ